MKKDVKEIQSKETNQEKPVDNKVFVKGQCSLMRSDGDKKIGFPVFYYRVEIDKENDFAEILERARANIVINLIQSPLRRKLGTSKGSGLKVFTKPDNPYELKLSESRSKRPAMPVKTAKESLIDIGVESSLLEGKTNAEIAALMNTLLK